ncbi:hypothetical protein A3H38_06410 [candidate division WOR-1 bacterium RIFCSPLOWO2_02_FULL_46_20]|uniref:Uncharacterized protein n=1 Tax=candidate division WOR-1 bacterium RIFCSPLOWO2_02_FULL_46_20 TaxID=1802567 RepID=A0A1F4RGX7_UNCSA|nr:MAG: hypothetical protein A3H38_06410 [candidate division WOR-1 bacterium RIFCSPLOWO2_02_FULL_46_20]
MTSGLERVFEMIDDITNALPDNIEVFTNNNGGGTETVTPEGGNPGGIDADRAGIWTQTSGGKDINLESAQGTYLAGAETLKTNYLTQVGTEHISATKAIRQKIERAISQV